MSAACIPMRSPRRKSRKLRGSRSSINIHSFAPWKRPNAVERARVLFERCVPTRARRAPRVHHGRALAARAARYAAGRRDSESVRRGPCATSPRAQGVHRRLDSAPARRRRRRVNRRAADAGLSARAAARGVSRTVERHARKSRRRNVLVAIFGEKQSQAVYLLGLQDVGRLDVVNYVSHGVPKIAKRRSPRATTATPRSAPVKRAHSSALRRISTRSPRPARSIR